MHQPREVPWTAALRILVYVKSSMRISLLHKKHEYVCISGYSDSGYTGEKGIENLLLNIAPLLEEIL